jgi:hypothetical protein
MKLAAALKTPCALLAPAALGACYLTIEDRLGARRADWPMLRDVISTCA